MRGKMMSGSVCMLFQTYENLQLEKTDSYCELAGVQTSCKGNMQYCERADTIRDYVLLQIGKRTKDPI